MARVGLVVVSHSRPLADAAVELALQMVHGERPPIEVAAGLPDGGLGTDAMAVMEAITAADRGDGVVVLVDLGSAVMSAEMALEFLDGQGEVRIVPAPFVEGLLAAAVRAAGGASLDQVADEASAALTPKLESLGGAPAEPTSAQAAADQPDAAGEATVVNEAGLHARPAALLAAAASGFDATVHISKPKGARVPADSPIGLATLAASRGDTLRVEATGPQAREAVSAVVALVRDGFGEMDQPSATTETRRDPSAPRGVSPGRVVGPAYRMADKVSEPDEERLTPDQTDAETARLADAVAAVADGYRHTAESAESDAAAILDATAALATDPALSRAAGTIIRDEQLAAPIAFWRATTEMSAALAAAGGRMAERVTDLTDIRDRVVAHLLGLAMPGLPEPGHPFVLLARDLAPADTATLSADTCLAIVTAEGGPTSHTTILARSMGIPAIVGYRDIAGIPDGTMVLVDGSTGIVVTDPDEAERSTARTAAVDLEPLRHAGGTADGFAVALLANVASAGGATSAVAAGAEGVGLFRTEVSFLDRPDEPTVDEQARAYSEVLAPFAGKKVTVRTLDAGSDKPIAFVTDEVEPNPALGIRGYRTAAAKPDILRRQLEAIVRATESSEADVWVMAPMISTPDEAHEFAQLARGIGVTTVGVMIETPSAALQAADILREVDFVSVGTNDLTQYTMAADRQSVGLGDLHDPWQPALLRLLRIIGDAGRDAAKPVGICGEAASDPRLAPVLVGLGVTTLSMSARALAPVGAALAAVTRQACQEAATAACAASTPDAARRAAGLSLGGNLTP